MERAGTRGHDERRAERRTVAACSAGAVVLGVVALCGWALGIPVLIRVGPGYKAIAPAVAACLVVLGLILPVLAQGGLSKRQRLLLAAVTGLVSLFGLLEVPGFLAAVDLNFEDALTRYAARLSSIPFETMSPIAGTLLFLLGGAMLALALRPREDPSGLGSAAAVAALAAGTIALVCALGYAYEAPALYRLGTVPISLMAVVGGLLLAVGTIAAAGPRSWPLRRLTGDSTRAQLLRVFVPLTIFVALTVTTADHQFDALLHVHHVLVAATAAVAYALIAGLIASRVAQTIGEAIDRARSEQQKAEEALRESRDLLEIRVHERTAQLEEATRAVQAERQRFNHVLETLPAYLVLLTPDYRVAYANRFFRERFGEARGRRCFEYLFGRSEPCEVCETYACLRNMAPHQWEWLGPDGRDYYIYDFPFTDTDGSTLILEMGIDITEQKRMQAELLQHRQHLEELVQQRTADLARANDKLAMEVAERERSAAALRRERSRMELLAQTAAHLLAAPDPLGAVNELCRRVMEFLDCQVFLNYLVGKEAGRLQLNACAGLSEKIRRTLEWLDYGVAICGCVAQDGCRIVAEHIPASSDPRTDLVKTLGIKAYACHPIKSGNEVLGTLSFGSTTRETFAEDELALMQAVTDQVAIAVARKRTQEALQESEQRYRGLFEAMQEGFALHEVICDEAGRPVDYRFLDVNRAFEGMTGLAREAVVGKTVLEVLPGTERYWIETYGRVALTGEPATIENYSSDLGRYYQAWAYSPRPRQFAVLFTDVTARRQAEAERERLLGDLRRQTAVLEAILENTDTHLVCLDRDFNFVWVNSAYARACGRSSEEFIGHNHFEFFPHEENEAIFRRARDTGQSVRYVEKPFDHPDAPERGTTYWDWTLVPLKNSQGEVESFIFSLADVTERVRTRERLLEAERARAQMAETIALEINHRMKNNLMLVSGMLELQLSSLPPDSDAARSLQQAKLRISALSTVHEQMYGERSERVELSDVLRRIGELAVSALAATDVELSVTGTPIELPSRVATTFAVVSNELLTNALKHGAAAADGKRRVSVTLSRQDGYLRLSVWNSGNPIPLDFDPASQQGLGLQLCRELVAGELNGSFAMRPRDEGTVCEIVVEMDQLGSAGGLRVV